MKTVIRNVSHKEFQHVADSLGPAMHVQPHEAAMIELLARQSQTSYNKECHKNYSECDKRALRQMVCIASERGQDF